MVAVEFSESQHSLSHFPTPQLICAPPGGEEGEMTAVGQAQTVSDDSFSLRKCEGFSLAPDNKAKFPDATKPDQQAAPL